MFSLVDLGSVSNTVVTFVNSLISFFIDTVNC